MAGSPTDAPGLCNECAGPLCDDMSEGFMICVRCGLRHSQMFIYEPEWKDYQSMRDAGEEVKNDRAGIVKESEIGAEIDRRWENLRSVLKKTQLSLGLSPDDQDGDRAHKIMKLYADSTRVIRDPEYASVAAIVLSSWISKRAPLWHTYVADRLCLNQTRLRYVMRSVSLAAKPGFKYFLQHNDHLAMAIRAYFALYPERFEEKEVGDLLTRFELKYGRIDLHKTMHYVIAAHAALTTEGVSEKFFKRAQEMGVGKACFALCRRFRPVLNK